MAETETAAGPEKGNAPLGKTSGGNSAFHNFNNDFSHIMDLNERRRLALAQIDEAPFGWYHVRAVVVAGVGFFTDSYDIFVASMLTVMLGIVYYPGVGAMPTTSDSAIKLSTSAGTVVGQLGFGIMADVVGRKRMYGLELIIIIFATLAQALTSESPSCSIIGLIIFWRVIMGVGIGGDYPLSSIITSEYGLHLTTPPLIRPTNHRSQVRYYSLAWRHDGFRVCYAGHWSAYWRACDAICYPRVQESARDGCQCRRLRRVVPGRRGQDVEDLDWFWSRSCLHCALL